MDRSGRGAVGVGYEGQDAERFVRQLDEAGVQVVVDVRLTPVSRKPGFSKRSLAASLTSAGIGYEHFPALGNPKDNRAGFTGDTSQLEAASARYAALLSTPDAVDALDRLTILAATNRVAVLCFEATDQRCHRQVVLSRVADTLRSDRSN